MTRIRPSIKNKSEAEELPSLHGRAMDNLRFIRETMEHSARFTAVPGLRGGVFMGLTAITAAFVANSRHSIDGWLAVWIFEAVLAFVVGMAAMQRKSKSVGTALNSLPAKKFAMSFLPPLICAVVITIGLWRLGNFEALIPIWILLYGAAIVTGGSFSVRVVPIMGWCFIALGTISFFAPASFGNMMMALSFGVLHIVFGLIIARRFGG